MFRFQSFMVLLVVLLWWEWFRFSYQKFNIKTIYGEKIEFHDKKFNKGQIIGGLIFWFRLGYYWACPGPIFAQIGTE
jgi:hypothetical protein